MKRPRGTRRAELYDRVLTADPPLCGRGNAVAVLNSCERRRRMLECICRFDANQIAEDASLFDCADVASAMEDSLEPDDVEALAGDLELCLGRAGASTEIERDARDRLERAFQRLERVIDAGAALTDEYSDAIEP